MNSIWVQGIEFSIFLGYHNFMGIIRKGIYVCLDLLILLFSSLLLYALFLAPNGLRLYFQIKTLYDAQSQTLESIRYQQSIIQNNKQLLERDEEYFDKEARVVWGYVKPKETLYWYHNMEKVDEMDKQ